MTDTDTNSPEQERRHIARHEVTSQVDAIDRLTGNNIGRLVDIHSEGLMLITDSQVTVGNIYQVSLKKEGDTWLDLGVDCLWKNPANGEDRFWAGFRVIDASDEALAQLENLGMEV